MIHHIRRSILDKLATADSLRYGQLKPSELDGNVFTYHLKGLITDDFVQKNDVGDYSLTQRGHGYIVRRYEDSREAAHSVFLVVLKNGTDYLLRRRDVQPHLGYTGFVHGEPEAGTPVLQTAVKRIFEKTGIEDVELSVVGSALIAHYHQEELLSYSNALIIYGETDQDMTVERDATGHNFWGQPASVENAFPSCSNIIKMIEDGNVWFERAYEL